MKIYNLKRTQILPLTLDEAWAFFSNPRNLAEITPPHMGFRILSMSGNDKMYPGQVIRYIVQGIPGINMHWVTEITHVIEPYYFVDEQRFGPYKWWHHQHHFREVEGGVEMTDEVNYALPLGPLGTLAHALFVKRELNLIFDYRFKKLEERFKKKGKSVVL
ncbi:MAG: SRPBCC family protein [Cyclobacteriaceae bacterium]|nr:SRPBCC family protein [Cyclobacteriaceae bacterium]MCX7636783.1 SRPBCC family protein [Cyclobacteriaceae bacterium]